MSLIKTDFHNFTLPLKIRYFLIIFVANFSGYLIKTDGIKIIGKHTVQKNINLYSEHTEFLKSLEFFHFSSHSC